MRNTIRYRIWLAGRIWLLVVGINTLLGKAFFTGFFSEPERILVFILLGLFYGILFSFPVFLILLLVIHLGVLYHYSGRQIFGALWFTGILFTILVFIFFKEWMGLHDPSMITLFGFALLAACTAILLEYQSFKRADDFPESKESNPA